MALLAKVILHVVTVCIITAGPLPVNITRNEQSIQQYLNQEITKQKGEESRIFTPKQTNNVSNVMKLDELVNKDEENKKYIESGFKKSETSDLMNPHASLDDCVFEDDIYFKTNNKADIITEILNDGISLDKTHSTALEDMQTENRNEKLDRLEDVTKKKKISIDEVLLSRLPLMEDDKNKRDINKELQFNKNNEPLNNVEKTSENFKVKSKLEKKLSYQNSYETLDFYGSKHDTDIRTISIPDNESNESNATDRPIVGVHHSQEEKFSPNLLSNKYKTNISGFKQNGKIDPSPYIVPNDILQMTHTKSSLENIDKRETYKSIGIESEEPPRILNVGDEPVKEKTEIYNNIINSVQLGKLNPKYDHMIYDENTLDHIFNESKLNNFTGDKDTNKLIARSEDYIMKILENYPNFTANNIVDIDKTSHLSGNVQNIDNSDKNLTFKNEVLNELNSVNSISVQSEFIDIKNIPLHEIVLLPNKVDNDETKKKTLIIDNKWDIQNEKPKDDLVNKKNISQTSEAGQISLEQSSNKESPGLGSTDLLKKLLAFPIIAKRSEANDETKIKELGQSDFSLPQLKYVEMIRNHKTIHDIFGDSEQKREVTDDESLMSEKNINNNAFMKEVEPKEETLVESNNFPISNKVKLEMEQNFIIKKEKDYISEAPIEIQMAEEELYIQADEESSGNLHRRNHIPLLEAENKKNWSCTPAEMDIFKDSFYQDELEEDFFLACMDKDIFNININDVYDESPIVDRDFIASVISPIASSSGTIAKAVVPADNENVPDTGKLTEMPVVPVRPAPNLQGQHFLNNFRSLPVNLQGFFLGNQSSGENILNRRQRISWSDIMQVLSRQNYSNQGNLRTQVPYNLRTNQVLPIYPLNEFELQRGLLRNTFSQNGKGLQGTSADNLNSSTQPSQRINIGHPLKPVPTLNPKNIGNPSSTDRPQPVFNQNIRRYPIRNGNQHSADSNSGIFSRLGTGVIRGIGGFFGAFRNSQPTNSWFG